MGLVPLSPGISESSPLSDKLLGPSKVMNDGNIGSICWECLTVRVYRCYVNDPRGNFQFHLHQYPSRGHRLVKFWTLPEGKGLVLRDNAIRSPSVLLILSNWKIPPSRIRS